MNIREQFRKHISIYPTRGRRFSEYGTKVKIFLFSILLLAISQYVLVATLFQPKNISVFKFVIFLFFNIVLEFYYDYHSMKFVDISLESPLGYFSLINVFLFANIHLIFVTIAIYLVSVFIFGIRRLANILFNISMAILCVIPAFFVMNSSLMTITVYDSLNIIIVTFLSSLGYILINSILLASILAIDRKDSIIKMFKRIFDLKKKANTFLYLITLQITVIIQPHLVFVFLVLIFFIMVGNVNFFKKQKRLLELSRKQMDTINNPIFIIEGYTLKIVKKVKEGATNEDIIQDLEAIQKQIVKMKEIIKQTKNKNKNAD